MTNFNYYIPPFFSIQVIKPGKTGKIVLLTEQVFHEIMKKQANSGLPPGGKFL